ncbi:DUF2345 domain-containing protein [Rhodoferax aquaticus]|uniref:DUF2345 domain-containing protein n=1 Tax=Rhodoferax aquaticus TaxID=2527691 RepID=UPI00143D597E|nr:DUF2345 domain-containing protein [Rhodoferax aquaticus]
MSKPLIAGPLIESTTAGSTHQHRQAHHAISAGGHVSTSTVKSWLLSAKEAIKLFAYGKGKKDPKHSGIKLVSAKADIDIQALQKSVNLLSKLDITVTANRVSIMAKERLVINGGGSQTVWSAAGIHSQTAGSHVAHAAYHGLAPGKAGSVSMPSLPFVPENLPKPYSIQINAVGKVGVVGSQTKAAALPKFRAYNDTGELLAQGFLDSKGNTPPIYSDKPETVRVVLGDGPWGKSADVKHA